jgi:hypothetical protein
MDPAWVGAATVAAATAAAFAGWAARWLWRIATRTSHFLDDYFGRPEGGGLPGRPGVMARLAQHEALLERLIAETEPNGGNSLRDVVARTAADVAGIKDEQGRLREQIEKGT